MAQKVGGQVPSLLDGDSQGRTEEEDEHHALRERLARFSEIVDFSNSYGPLFPLTDLATRSRLFTDKTSAR